MKNRILIATIITFLIIFCQFNTIISQSINKEKNIESNINKYVIEKFPYVSQETNFYCTYACPTMILKYYGFETDLYEVLFNSVPAKVAINEAVELAKAFGNNSSPRFINGVLGSVYSDRIK